MFKTTDFRTGEPELPEREKVMKRYVFVISAILVLIGGCQRQHPSVITIDPEFDSAEVMTILVVPTISSITSGDDPTRQSEILVDRVLWEFMNERNDYVFIRNL